MQPTQAGRYIARPIEWTVNESNKGLPQFVCKFDLLQYESRDGWSDISADQQQTTGWFNLIYMKDGQPVRNDISFEQLMDALGWDGASLTTLSTTDWSAVEVQIVMDWENYKGKDQLKIKFLNPRDYGGGMKKSAPEEVQSIESKYGALLRATAKKNGSSNGSATAPRTNTPLRQQPAANTSAPAGNTKVGAWTAFKSKVVQFNQEQPDQAYTPEKMAEAFKTTLGTVFGIDKDLNTLTPAEWQQATDKIRTDFSPATGDLIPF